MKILLGSVLTCAFAVPMTFSAAAQGTGNKIDCGKNYTVVSKDTLSGISLRAYGSLLYQPIYTANVDTIGSNPDIIHIGQNLMVPCLSASGTALADTADAENDDAALEGRLIFTFNKASAPPFISNSGIVDAYLAEITEVTDGRVNFVDPEVINRDHSEQFAIVKSGEVDGAYVLNSYLAESHPLLQLPMQPMFGGSAEQTAVSMWRLHDEYLSETDYFSEAQILGFFSAPAAHIWRDSSMPITTGENIAYANEYQVPYFHGLDTRGPAAMRTEVAEWIVEYNAMHNEAPTFFLAHGAAIALGLWDEESTVSVMEVDNGLYTPTFSLILSNDAWAQISPQDQQAIREVSGEALARRSAAWDAFDNSFRSRMLERGLVFEKADKALLDELFMSSLGDLREWMDSASALGIPSSDAVNFYLTNLRSLEDRLIYRGEEPYYIDEQHPFLTGGL